MTPNATVIRSRSIRAMLLNSLWTVDGAGLGLGLTYGQLSNGFAASKIGISEPELRRELNDLVDARLAARTWDEDMRDDMYTIANRGRDFKRAGCPWDKIDDFS